MKKRLLAFLLVLVMVVGFIPVTARAEGTAATTPELGSLFFSTMRVRATAADARPMEPAFDTSVREYTLPVYDYESDSAVNMYYTLGENAEGQKVFLTYTNLFSGSEMTMEARPVGIMGTGLSGGVTTPSLIGNTVHVKIGTTQEEAVEAYTVRVVRIATLSDLTITDQDGNAIELDAAFD